MIILKRIILILLLIGFSGIQLASLIDDPQHLLEPDPNCPICMASQTSLCINHHITIEFTPDIIIYLTENVFFVLFPHIYYTNLSTRAPPFISTQ